MIILFYNLDTKNNIILFYLLLYFIIFISTLDIKVFQSFKHYYTDEIDKTI